ncbi:MAG: hypothetical protein ACI4E1_00710 [Lachnospira sp.]
MSLITYFKRSTFKINVRKIYPRWFGGCVLLFEILAVFMVYYFSKLKNNDALAMLGLFFIYIIDICEFYIRYKIKSNYFSQGFEMGKNTDFYMNKVKMIFPISILVTIGCNINIFISMVIIQRYTLYDIYWIWMVTVVTLLVLEPFLDLTTGFKNELILTDNKIIDLSYVQDVCITKERKTSKGSVYEVEFWANGEKVGKDRYFEEDFLRIKKYLLDRI